MKAETEALVMAGVEEHTEELDVELATKKGRLVVRARNEGGFNFTEVDLEQLLKWVAENRPEIYMQNVSESMKRDFT